MRRKRVALGAAIAAVVGSLSLYVWQTDAMPVDQMRQGCAASGGIWWWIDMDYRSCTWSLGDGSYVRSIVDRRGREVAVCEGDGDVEICDDF